MQDSSELRICGVVDHIAVRTEDMEGDVREYERLGFRVETLYEDWAMLRDDVASAAAPSRLSTSHRTTNSRKESGATR